MDVQEEHVVQQPIQEGNIQRQDQPFHRQRLVESSLQRRQFGCKLSRTHGRLFLFRQLARLHVGNEASPEIPKLIGRQRAAGLSQSRVKPDRAGQVVQLVAEAELRIGQQLLNSGANIGCGIKARQQIAGISKAAGGRQPLHGQRRTTAG